MIEINLVPDNIRKKRRDKTVLGHNVSFALPQESVVGIIGGAIILLIFVHVTLQVFIMIKFVQLKTFKHSSDKISTEKTNVDRIVGELKRLQEKYKSVEKITRGKDLLWSKKLNQFSDNLSRGVWLTRITMDDKTLLIQGSSVSKGKTEMMSVHTLTSNLKSDKDYMESFNDLELGLIKSRTVGETPIADFTIRADITTGAK